MTAVDDAAAGGPGTRAPASKGRLVELLREDHREILQLFDRIEQRDRREVDPLLSLFKLIEEALQRHLEGEERFVYTALERHEEARDQVLEGYELHRLCTMTIGGFKTLALDDERWKPKLRVLRRLVEVHVHLQEEELFPVALRVLDGGRMNDIAEQFIAVRSGRDRRRGGPDAPE